MVLRTPRRLPGRFSTDLRLTTIHRLTLIQNLKISPILREIRFKSDYRDPYQARELYARDKGRVVPGLRWRPCRSSRLLRAYQTRTYKTSLRMLLAAIGDVLTPSRTFRCGSFRRSSSSPR